MVFPFLYNLAYLYYYPEDEDAFLKQLLNFAMQEDQWDEIYKQEEYKNGKLQNR